MYIGTLLTSSELQRKGYCREIHEYLQSLFKDVDYLSKSIYLVFLLSKLEGR
ncbi:hypothetical protein SORBI_3010G133632 [Sorghum bicolor]|uniref:Uncharacterized protein n=1 Tax=Sorghum bicolor TaxID=4558 RepID=A0A1W0VSU2_SORBI|nr:hypothetical protein SORBI_3010G133632 [Sorghum bicolor]